MVNIDALQNLMPALLFKQFKMIIGLGGDAMGWQQDSLEGNGQRSPVIFGHDEIAERRARKRCPALWPRPVLPQPYSLR